MRIPVRIVGKRRPGTSAVEFALLLPLLMMILFGIWEVGRMVEVNQIMWGAVREAAREASTGSDNLSTVATNSITYLVNAEPAAFGNAKGQTIVITNEGPDNYTNPTGEQYTWVSARIGTSGGTKVCSLGYYDWANTANTDPTTATQLDKFDMILVVPYSEVSWVGTSYLFPGPMIMQSKVTWYCLNDSVLPPVLPLP